MIDVLLGLQWGDEGKGKIVDYLAKDYQIIARFQGGPNAGHTLYIGDKKVVLHTIPSGIFHSNILNLIGNGVVLDPITLQKEIAMVTEHGVDVNTNLFISEKTHIILPSHRALDRANEAAKGEAKIGSTLKGIGPAYMDKTGRNGLRVGDIKSAQFNEKYQTLKKKHIDILMQMGADASIDAAEEANFMAAIEKLALLNIVNAEYWINNEISEGKKVLAEGAQGSMLDVDFGTYPFVTSSNTTIAGVCSGLGVAPKNIRNVIGITKAYCTRVGSGPFPTELHDEMGEQLRKTGNEFGATTGRPRRCGWIDLVALKYACMLSGVNSLIITKADVLNEIEWLQACTAYQIDGKETKEFPYDACSTEITPVYKELRGWRRSLDEVSNLNNMPAELIRLIDEVESYTGVKVRYVSNGVGRDQIVAL